MSSTNKTNPSVSIPGPYFEDDDDETAFSCRCGELVFQRLPLIYCRDDFFMDYEMVKGWYYQSQWALPQSPNCPASTRWTVSENGLDCVISLSWPGSTGVDRPALCPMLNVMESLVCNIVTRSFTAWDRNKIIFLYLKRGVTLKTRFEDDIISESSCDLLRMEPWRKQIEQPWCTPSLERVVNCWFVCWCSYPRLGPQSYSCWRVRYRG